MGVNYMTVKVKAALLSGAMMLAACSADAGNAQSVSPQALLASDLVYKDVAGQKDLSFKLDPWLSEYPSIAREVRRTKLAALNAEDCTTNRTCSVSSNIEMHYGGARLVSLIDTTSSYYGGAHPSMTAEDFIFDAQSGQRLRFANIFNSWSAARELLQRQWCGAVSKHSACPPIEKQALALSGGSEGINGIFVQTSDYAFGNYAEGSDKAFLSITPELIALAKPEYQPFFTLEMCC